MRGVFGSDGHSALVIMAQAPFREVAGADSTTKKKRKWNKLSPTDVPPHAQCTLTVFFCSRLMSTVLPAAVRMRAWRTLAMENYVRMDKKAIILYYIHHTLYWSIVDRRVPTPVVHRLGNKTFIIIIRENYDVVQWFRVRVTFVRYSWHLRASISLCISYDNGESMIEKHREVGVWLCLLLQAIRQYAATVCLFV